MAQTTWTAGDRSGSTTLVNNQDTILAGHVNELRTAVNTLEVTSDGLGTISTQASSDVSITGGSITGITDLAVADGGTGSSTAATARTALGVQAYTFATVGSSNAEYITDGTADDVQIQAAIDAVSAAGGGVVHIKGGTYNLGYNTAVSPYNPQILRYGINLKSNVYLEGEGINATILAQTEAGWLSDWALAICPVGASNFGMSNMSLDIADPTYAPYIARGGAFLLKGPSHCIFKNLYMNHNGSFRIEGYTKSYSSSTKYLTTDAHDIQIDHCYFADGLGSMTFIDLRDLYLTNCTQMLWYDDPILLSGACQHIVIDNYYFDGNQVAADVGGSTAAIFIANDGSTSSDYEAMSDITITNSTIMRHNLNGSYMGGCAGVSCKSSTFVKIHNVLIDGCGSGVNNAGGSLNGQIEIKNCTIVNCGNSGINFPSSGGSEFALSKSDFSHNKIYNNVNYGIRVDTQKAGTHLKGLICSHNEVFDNKTPHTQLYGIAITANGAGVIADQIIFTDNLIYDNDSYQVSFGVGASASMTNFIARNNIGFVTENSGTGTIASGATTVVITHGLSVIPTADDITVIPTNGMGNASKFWITTLTSTQFTINVDVDPGADTATFAWKGVIL